MLDATDMFPTESSIESFESFDWDDFASGPSMEFSTTELSVSERPVKLSSIAEKFNIAVLLGVINILNRNVTSKKTPKIISIPR